MTDQERRMTEDTTRTILLGDFAIRQLYARFADAVWRKDTASFANCFSEDAEWRIAAMHLKGRDAIAKGFESLVSNSERILISYGLPVLEIGAGVATGRIHISEFARRSSGHSTRSVGVYYDKYSGRGLDWCFTSRFYALTYSGPADWSQALLPCPDYGPHPAAPGPDVQAPKPLPPK